MYYFAGMIMKFPPNIADLFIVGVIGFFAGLSYMGIRTEQKKKDLAAMHLEIDEVY